MKVILIDGPFNRQILNVREDTKFLELRKPQKTNYDLSELSAKLTYSSIKYVKTPAVINGYPAFKYKKP